MDLEKKLIHQGEGVQPSPCRSDLDSRVEYGRDFVLVCPKALAVSDSCQVLPERKRQHLVAIGSIFWLEPARWISATDTSRTYSCKIEVIWIVFVEHVPSEVRVLCSVGFG